MKLFGGLSLTSLTFLMLLLASCGPSDEDIAATVETQLAQAATATARAAPTETPVPTSTPTVTPTHTPAPTETPSYLTIERLNDVPEYPGSRSWVPTLSEWNNEFIFRTLFRRIQDFEKDTDLDFFEVFDSRTVSIPRSASIFDVYSFYTVEGFGPLDLDMEANTLEWSGDTFFITIRLFEESLGQSRTALWFLSGPYLDAPEEE